jgi:hypothetical protein
MFVPSDDRHVVKCEFILSILEDTMKALVSLLSVAALLALAGAGPASAGKSIIEEGARACVIDKWDVKEPEKGHKLVDYAGRCIYFPDDPAMPKGSDVCTGKLEFMADGSYKGSGTCDQTIQGGDKKTVSWEEGTHMKEKVYKNTGGTGKYAGATGGGTYTSENITDATIVGRYKGKAELP